MRYKGLNVSFAISADMYFDVAMPLTLFLVTLAAMFLDKKAEQKLKVTLEERKFEVRDAVMLVVSISIMVSIIMFIPQLAIMAVFLFSYSLLLFIFTYLFSDLDKTRARFFLLAFMLLNIAAGTLNLNGFGLAGDIPYGSIAFFGSAAFAAVALLHEGRRAPTGERWYLAALPPALFIFLYLFFGRTSIWFPYLLDVYGIVFAVLIIIYLGSLFTWKTSLIFVGLLTIMDVILVLFTGTMVSAAKQVSGLALPVLVSVPTIPISITRFGLLYMSLGLGDFFFAGLIGVQTYRKYGVKVAVMSLATMVFSFLLFETYLLNSALAAFPGTLMILCGWIPILVWKEGNERLYIAVMPLSLAFATFLLINFGAKTLVYSWANSPMAYIALALLCLFGLTFTAFLHKKTIRTG